MTCGENGLTRVLLTLALAATAAGCSYGMTAAKFRPATDPHGVMGTTTTGSSVLRGELIEVQDAALILLASGDGGGGRRGGARCSVGRGPSALRGERAPSPSRSRAVTPPVTAPRRPASFANGYDW